MNGLNLNNAYNIGGRIQLLKQYMDIKEFKGRRAQFLTAVHALNVGVNDIGLIPAIVDIINGIVGDQQPERNDLISFANKQIENTFQAHHDMLDIEELQGLCGDNGCNGCPSNSACHEEQIKVLQQEINMNGINLNNAYNIAEEYRFYNIILKLIL